MSTFYWIWVINITAFVSMRSTRWYNLMSEIPKITVILIYVRSLRYRWSYPNSTYQVMTSESSDHRRCCLHFFINLIDRKKLFHFIKIFWFQSSFIPDNSVDNKSLNRSKFCWIRILVFSISCRISLEAFSFILPKKQTKTTYM